MTKILVDKSVIEQALEALNYERTANNPLDWHHDKTMQALRTALEQQQVEQEPIAWMTEDGRIATDATKQSGMASTSKPNFSIPLFTHQQPPRQPLTEMQIVDLRQLTPGTLDVQFVKFARVLEAAHGIGESNA